MFIRFPPSALRRRSRSSPAPRPAFASAAGPCWPCSAARPAFAPRCRHWGRRCEALRSRAQWDHRGRHRGRLERPQASLEAADVGWSPADMDQVEDTRSHNSQELHEWQKRWMHRPRIWPGWAEASWASGSNSSSQQQVPLLRHGTRLSWDLGSAGSWKCWAQVAGEKDCTKPKLQAQARHFLYDMKIPGWKVGCGEGLFGLFGYSCSHVQLIFVARGLHLQQLAEGYWRLWPRCTMLQIKPWNCSKKTCILQKCDFIRPDTELPHRQQLL